MRDLKFEKTGEKRPPQAGEWFVGYKGFPVQAMFDFKAQSFEIVRIKIVEDVDDTYGVEENP